MEEGSRVRSAAAQKASRRNGGKSRGPRTAAGKAISATNAVKHGLRARQVVLPENLPDWVRAVEANLIGSIGPLAMRVREQLDRLLQILVLIETTDQCITEEFARLRTAAGGEEAAEHGSGALSPGEDLASLRKLVAYRRRFRAQRDLCLRRIISQRRIADS